MTIIQRDEGERDIEIDVETVMKEDLCDHRGRDYDLVTTVLGSQELLEATGALEEAKRDFPPQIILEAT